jgi:hypothetical protein
MDASSRRFTKTDRWQGLHQDYMTKMDMRTAQVPPAEDSLFKRALKPFVGAHDHAADSYQGIWSRR